MTVEVSVVPLSRSRRSLSHYVAKRTMTLGQAKGIPLSAYTKRTTTEARSHSVLELAKQMQQGPFEVERQGTTAVLGTSGSYDRYPTMEGMVEAASGKRK